MKTLKYSRQRESIKASLMNRKDHPTADAVCASIREEFPNISLGTVYRNLNLLVELGEVQKLTFGDGKHQPALSLCMQKLRCCHRSSHGAAFRYR